MTLFGRKISVEKVPKSPKKTSSKAKKKRMETSKKLAWWAVVVATLVVITHYTQAALGLEPAAEVTTSVFAACVGWLVTYGGKSLGEKISRNRHGLGEDGKPLSTAKGEDHP